MKRCHHRRWRLSILALIVLALFAGMAAAAPMFGVEWKLKQPDGKFVDVRIWGDEYYQDVESPDGYTLVRDPVTNVICYAKLSADGNEYVSTGIRVGSRSPASLGLQKRLRINPGVRSAQAQHMRDLAYAPETQMLVSRGMKLADPPDNGNVVGLCLLADFSDQVATIPQADVVNFCNQIGYNQNGNNGSVRDYFSAVSDGHLTYTSYVSPAYYRPTNAFSWYDDCTEPWLARGKGLIVEILNNMESGGFDFSSYDSNGDGLIDAVNLFYAGSTACGWAKGMWPGSGSMGGFAADGVSVNRFQLTGMGGSLTIRTYCHENGHMICYYPDLYDYDDDSNGVGDYCLMASGGSNTNPTEICAPLKLNAGWATVMDLGSAATGLSLPAGTNTFYRYTRPFNIPFIGENFLIENRQKTGRDAALPDAGLAIWHVEEVFGDHSNQGMTTFGHYPYTLVQADGDWDLENDVNDGDNTDLYAAPSFKSLTACTDPNTDWWDGSESGLSVTNVSTIGANMTFDFSPGDDDPVAMTKSYAADADHDCCITVSVANINDGSFDPDGPGDIASLCITAVDGSGVGCVQSTQVCGDGNHTVTLTITDLCGNTDTADATVEVVNSPPVAVGKAFAADADDNCCMVVHLSDVDGGTQDPDGFADIETFCITAVDGSSVGCVDQVTVCGDGTHTVSITATDYCGFTSSADASVEVIDVTPPEIAVQLNRDVLWPPNHKLVEVCATIEATDNCDPDPDIALVWITSSESDNDKGDGNTINDIQNAAYGTEDLCFSLRSERQGSGNGRVYTIAYSAEDESGNVAYDTVRVRVPHDQSGSALASTGFLLHGTELEQGAPTFAVIIPSTATLDAATIDRSRIYLGNSKTVARPTELRIVDANNDGRLDMGVFFMASSAEAFSAEFAHVGDQGSDAAIDKNAVIGDGPVGVHFVSATGVDYLVWNIYALGDPVAMPTFSLTDPPKPFEDGTPAVQREAETGLTSIHPNPFNPETTVEYALRSAQRVQIAIYDVRGTLVRRLVDQSMPAGEHRATWNGIDDAGRSVTSGIYFVRMIAGRHEQTRKIVMLK